MQWHEMLLPRIHRYLSNGNILEIACGRGRWTKFLNSASNSLIGVDLSKNNIDFCKTRFKSSKHAKFYKNNGKSLDMVKDVSIDFIFSCDSLVHVNPEVIEGYMSQFNKILKPNGVIFLHHSNLYEYKNKLSKKADIHWRDKNVDAKVVEKLASKYKLQCISQEKVQWLSKTKHFIDCFSIITKKDSKFARKNIVYKNKNFQKEIKNSFLLSQLYSPSKIKINTPKDLIYVLHNSLGALKLPHKCIIKTLNSPYDSKNIIELNKFIQKDNENYIAPFIINFLAKHNIKQIIIYGAGEIFEKLEKNLRKTNIKILHIIDKKAEQQKFKINGHRVKTKDILKSNPKIPIVVASFAFADEIVKELEAYKKDNGLKNEIYDLHRCLFS